MSAYDTNDPDQILKNSFREILGRLLEDSNRLASLGAIDQEVLRGLVDPEKSLKSGQDKKLEKALSCVEAVVKNAYGARHALD